MGAPSWLLKIVISFLQDRSMIIWYKGALSCPVSLPDGGPQGTLLRLLLFIVLIDDLGFGDQHENIPGEVITCKKILKEINKILLKYEDDFLIAESINLSNQLVIVPTPRQRPPRPVPCQDWPLTTWKQVRSLSATPTDCQMCGRKSNATWRKLSLCYSTQVGERISCLALK